MSDNMVKEELGNGLEGVIKHGHCFNPFGEVVNLNDNVFVVIVRGGAIFHEVNAPFTKWVGNNDQV